MAIDRPKMVADTKAAYEANRQQKSARAEASLGSPQPSAPHRDEEPQDDLTSQVPGPVSGA